MNVADVHNTAKRSYNMSQIHSKDTNPEILVRKYLFFKGFRYRKNDTRFPGNPDIVLPKYRTIIFINGCFWHKHENCKYFFWPKSREGFWTRKLNENASRDDRNYKLLTHMGWKVIIIWECDLKREKITETLEALTELLLLTTTS